MHYHVRTPVLATLVLLLVAPQVALPAAAEARVRQATISSQSIPPQVREDFGRVRQGEPVVLEITVTNSQDKVLTIGAVQPLCACMSETSDRGVQPGSRGSISLRLETDEYSGPTTEAALIQWTNAPVAVTRVELTLDVQPVLEILPKRLVRFRGVEGKPSEEVLELKTADGAAFQVTGVETSAPHLSATASALGTGHYRLTVTLAPDAPTGMLRETVTVHTDLPTLPAVKLNVTGLVAAPAKNATPQPDTSG